MNHMDEQPVLDNLAVSQSPIIIFEKLSKEETAKAEERLKQQAEDQKRLEAELKRREEESQTHSKPQ